jgi:Cft2 family RNA processing exonuclease
VIGTRQTLSAYAIRWSGGAAGLTHFQPVAFGEPFHVGRARLTAFPASHILGAAQLLIEYGGERLVYTGDIKLRPPLCGETTVPVPCDRLIIESTFGLPVYRTLDRESARERIVAFAQDCLAEGLSPVFQGYALGRGQEIAHVLCQAGIPTAVHGAIAKFIPLYEENGYGFPGWEPYESRTTQGKALVVVPSFRATLEASGKNIRVAYVSGWACLDNARARSGAEELIPYSDHADFYELLELVERSGAREVDVVHGYTVPFARVLEQRGLTARAPLQAAGRDAGEEAEG